MVIENTCRKFDYNLGNLQRQPDSKKCIFKAHLILSMYLSKFAVSFIKKINLRTSNFSCYKYCCGKLWVNLNIFSLWIHRGMSIKLSLRSFKNYSVKLSTQYFAKLIKLECHLSYMNANINLYMFQVAVLYGEYSKILSWSLALLKILTLNSCQN